MRFEFDDGSFLHLPKRYPVSEIRGQSRNSYKVGVSDVALQLGSYDVLVLNRISISDYLEMTKVFCERYPAFAERWRPRLN